MSPIVNLIGIKHGNKSQCEQICQFIDLVEPKTCLFLLEYNKKSYVMYKKSSKIFHFDEFFYITNKLIKNRIKYHFIDEKAYIYSESFYSSLSFKRLFLFLIKKKIDNKAEDLLVHKREKEFIKEIKKRILNSSQNYVLIGKDHLSNVKKLLNKEGIKTVINTLKDSK